VLAIAVARDGEDLLVVTGNGYGKRTPISDYPRKGRPTKGVRTIKVSDKKGELVAAWPVREGQELLLMSQLGKIIRIETGSIRRTGRSTEGVRLMDMGDDDQVSAVASVVEPSAAAGGDDDGVLDTDEALEGAAADAEAEDLAADAVEDVLDGGGAPEGEGP
jgi:DNA gyrase subunit A